MKIGILTFFRPINHGAILQACATSNIVCKKYSDNVQLIDYRMPRIEYYRNNLHMKEIIKLIMHPKILMKRIFGILYYAPKSYRQKRNFDNFIHKYLNLSQKCIDEIELSILSNSYDMIVVGSDLVWNPEMTEGINPIYYLQFVENEKIKKISYAASIGLTSLSPDDLKIIGKFLDTFDYISVRENSAKKMLEQYSNKEIVHVLDPTLLTKADEWCRFMKPIRKKIRRPYLLVFMLEQSQLLINTAKKLANLNGISIVTYGSKRHFGMKSIDVFDAGPDEMLSIIKESDLIITNSFHGCAFSIIFEKNFWCIPHTTRGTRMIELLSSLGLNERIVKDDNVSYGEEIDYKTVSENRNLYVRESLKYLNKSIGGE